MAEKIALVVRGMVELSDSIGFNERKSFPLLDAGHPLWRSRGREWGSFGAAAIHIRADAAAVSAMATGSQHMTINAISHRIARSEPASAPTRSATQRIGAASVSIRPPCAAREARCAQPLRPPDERPSTWGKRAAPGMA
jgi:hypothetical protein